MSENRVFNTGGKVSASSLYQRNALQARDLGPYLVIEKVLTLHWTFKAVMQDS